MKGQFEKEIREKLEGVSAPVSAGLFDSIIAKRAKKKRAIWWYGSAAVLLLLLSGLGYLLQSDNDDLLSKESTELATVNEAQNDESSVENEDVVSDIDSDISNLPADYSDEEAMENIIPAQTDRSEQSASGNATTTPAAQIDVDENTVGDVEPEIVVQETESGFIEEEGIDTEDLRDLFKQIEKQKDEETDNPGRLFVRDREIESDKIKEPNWKDEAVELDVEDDSKTDDEEVETTVVVIPNTQDDTSSSSNDPDLEGNNLPNPKWYLDIYGGPGFASHSLSGNSPELQARINSETAKSAYGFGFEVGYNLNSKWSVRTGLYQTTRNQTFDFTRTTETINQFDTLVERVVIHPVEGKIITLEDSSWTTTETSVQNYNSINSYKQLAIPVRIERTMLIGKKWYGLANVGAQFGINQKNTGTTLDPNLALVPLTDLKFRRFGVNSASAGLGLGYAIRENALIYLYPQANIGLGASTTSQSEIKLQEFGVFTNLGLRFKF